MPLALQTTPWRSPPVAINPLNWLLGLFSLDIGIDLDEKYGLGSGGKYTGTAKIGKVTVKRGQVYWNGQPLGNQEQGAIAAACRRMYGNK